MFRTFRGGLRFDLTGNSAATAAIRRFDESERLIVSMDQGGGPCNPLVSAGDRVLRYQMIGAPQDEDGTPVYAPVSGTVEEIADLPHPVRGVCKAVVLKDDGLKESRPLQGRDESEGETVARDVLLDIARKAAIPGPMLHARPEFVRMRTMIRRGVRTLVCGAAECEPYLAHESRICAEYPHEVVGGLLLLMRAVCAQEAVIAFTSLSEEAERAIRRELRARRTGDSRPPVKVARVAAKYPAEQKLKTMFETPARRIGEKPVPAGVTSPFACLALYRAFTEGRPVTDVFLTVSGSAVERPNVYEVPIGTPMEDLFRRSVTADGVRTIIAGGLMNGLALDNWDYPVVRNVNALLAMTETTEFSRADDCIHCNQCGKVCPEGLSPSQICEYLLQNDLKEAESLGLRDCRLCGCCTYICPGRMELTEILKNGKKALEP